MPLFASRSVLLAACAATLVQAVPQIAEAASHGHVRSVQGRFGHGYVANRNVSRAPGSASVTRQRTYNDGLTSAGSRSIVRNDDGSVAINRSHTGVAGDTQSSWSSIYRTDDGYTRTGGAETSSGRSFTGSKDISVSDGAVTVDKSVTTGSGANYTSSRTYPRGR